MPTARQLNVRHGLRVGSKSVADGTGVLVDVGNISTLSTTDRSSIVAAVNEVKSDFTNIDTGDVAEDPGFLYFTTARARESISVTDTGGDGSLSYDNVSGVLTFTGPSAAEVRAHFSGGTGVTITDGVVAIGQPVSTTSNVTFNDTTLTGVLYGPSQFVIDPAAYGDITGEVIILGDLTVQGTTTTIDSTVIEIEDKNILLAKSASNSLQADGAGISIGGSNANILYAALTDSWNLNRTLKGVDGDSSSPTYSFSSDPGLGLYRSADNQVSLATNGLERFRVSDTAATLLSSLDLVFDRGTYDGTVTTATLTSNRTYTLPDTSGTLVTSGDTGTVTSAMIVNGTIVNEDINANAEIAVSKLADGSARQLLQTDAAGTGVEWTDNIDVPGTLDVTGNAVFDSTLGVGGNTTGVVAGVTVTSKFCVKQEGTSPVGGFVHAENSSATTGSGIFACRSRGTLASPLIVENNDRLASLFIAGHDGVDLALAAEIDFEVDGSPGSNNMPGRIIFRTTPSGDQSPVERLRIDSTGLSSFAGSVTLSSGNDYRINGTKVLDATSLGSTVVSSSLTSVGTIGTGVWQGTAITDTYLATISTAGKVSNSATTATSANTASAIVARDGSGNFTAGTITAALTGNADTATKLSSTRTFAVTGDITGTVNSDLTSGASIATSIAAGVIVDGDINASAGIAFSKLAPLTSANILVGSGGNVATSVAVTGDVTIGNTGVTAISSGVIVDADVSATAEIAVSKLADGSPRQLLQTDAAGTGVEWTDDIDIPGTLDVTGNAVFDSRVTVNGTDITESARDIEESRLIRRNGTVSIGTPGTVPFGVGPVIPPGMSLVGIGPDSYNVIDIYSGSVC